jgi:uncharacterized protein YlxW (UPF0749 family)
MAVTAFLRTAGAWRLVQGAALRPAVAPWLLLAVLGWGVAGAATFGAVHEYQMASRLSALAGLTPVSGPGIEVVLSDATRALPAGEDPNAALVQDSDLFFLTMMLWYGGARAVAINGQRVTAQSTITSSGPVILLDGHRLVGPFHVTAVGDPEVLRGVLEARAGFAERMRASGLGVEIDARPHLVVPARAPGAR